MLSKDLQGDVYNTNADESHEDHHQDIGEHRMALYESTSGGMRVIVFHILLLSCRKSRPKEGIILQELFQASKLTKNPMLRKSNDTEERKEINLKVNNCKLHEFSFSF